MSSAVKAVTKVFNIVAKPLQKLFGALMPKPPNVGATASGNELKQIIRSSKEPARYVFGRTGTGALLAWAQEEPGEQDEAEKLHLVYVLTEGGIHGIDEIYVDQESINSPAAAELIEYEIHSDPATPNAYMLEHSPDWRDSQIGRNLTWVRVTLKYDPEYFASGIPDLLFEYRACNDIYDPRTETSDYSNNAALVILWYVRHRLKVPDDEILWDTFIDAANVCAEIITNPDGSTEPRYTVSGGFKADERKDRVLADLEAACAGSLIRVGGKFGLQVGAYYGPYELTIDEDMVIGTVTGQTEVSRADAVNTMRGKFVSPQQRWTETDYPAVSVAEWIIEDGEEIEDTLDLRFVSSPYQAQRLANIALRRKRAGGTLELPLNFRGYACRPGRVVQVNLPTLNILGEFRVVDWDFSGENGCKVTLQQEQAEIYDDAVGQPFDPFGFISLPTGGIGSPTGLQYVLESVGEVIQGRLVWNPVDAALHYNVVIKRDGLAVQSAQVPAGVERCDVGGLEAGNYTAEVRARGRLGQSAPAVISFNINVPPMPESVDVVETNDTITLTPRLSGDHGRVEFEFRWHPAPLPLNQVTASAVYLSIGASYTHTGLTWGTQYHYYVRTVNAYGASPWLYVLAETTFDIEQIMLGLTNEIRETHLYQTLAERIDKIDGPETLDGSVAQRIAEQVEQRGNELEEVRGELIEGFQAEALARAQAIQEETENRTVAVTNLTEQVESEFGLLGLQINAIAAAYDATAASIYTMTQIRIDDQEVVATQISQLAGRVDNNDALILNEQQIRINQYSSLATQVGILSARLDVRPSLNSGFEPGADFNAWSATSGNSISALTSGVYSGLQSALVTSTTASANASTGGVRRIIAPETATEFAGHEIRLSVYAKQPESGASAEFALSYQVAGESAQWYRFTPSSEWAFYDVVIGVPAETGSVEHAASIWGDTAGGGNGVQLDRLMVTFAEIAIPEVTAAIEQIQQALVDQDQALAQELTGFSAQLDTNTAAIQQEITARTTLTDSLANSVQTLQAATQYNAAAIVAEREAWSTETDALAQQIDQLVADVGDGGVASIAEERRVRASEDEYLASLQRVLSAAEGVNSASYQYQTTTQINDREAEATRSEQLQAQIGESLAAIESEATVRASETEALTQQINTQASVAANNTALIQTESTTRASAVGALAEQINTVQVEFNDELASVQQATQVQYNQATQRLEAMWTLRIDNGGRVSGIGLADDGEMSSFAIRADRFYIAHPNDPYSVLPMIIDGGQVLINDALINKLLFTKLRSSDGSLVFENGKLRAEYIQANQIEVVWGQITGTKPAQNADKTGDNTAYDTARVGGTNAGTVRNQAANGDAANNRVTNWTRPNSTLINGNQISAADAFLDTVQIKGQAVTIPSSAQAGGEVRIPRYWFSVLACTFVSTGAPISISANATLRMAANNPCVAQMRLLLNGAVVWASTVMTSTGDTTHFQMPSVTVLRTAGSGPCNITLQLQRSGDGDFGVLDVFDRNITAIEVKR